MKELDVPIFLANSPQAKGRVERRHGVMQDRLIKVMRLKKVNDMVAANRLLEGGFLAKENLKFVKKAKRAHDGHRRLPKGMDLRVVLSIQEEDRVGAELIADGGVEEPVVPIGIGQGAEEAPGEEEGAGVSVAGWDHALAVPGP